MAIKRRASAEAQAEAETKVAMVVAKILVGPCRFESGPRQFHMAITCSPRLRPLASTYPDRADKRKRNRQ